MREEILRLLEKNSRIDIKEIAILVGKTETEVTNEIAQMEKEGIIRGYYTLINWDNTNDERVSALIEVKVTPLIFSIFTILPLSFICIKPNYENCFIFLPSFAFQAFPFQPVKVSNNQVYVH